LGSGSKAQTDAVEVEGGGQLGVGFGQMGEEKAVVIDVKTEGQAGALEGQTEELQMGQKRFPFIEADNDHHAAVIVNQIEQGRLPLLADQPAVGRSVVLPELADLLGLPAAHGLARLGTGRDGQTVFQGKAPDGGAVQLEMEAAHHLGGDQAVGTRRPGFEQARDQGGGGRGPRLAMVAAGAARRPTVSLSPGAGAQIAGIDAVEAAAADRQFHRRADGLDLAGAKALADIADQWRI